MRARCPLPDRYAALVRLRAAFDAAEDGIVVFADGRATELNRAAAKIFGVALFSEPVLPDELRWLDPVTHEQIPPQRSPERFAGRGLAMAERELLLARESGEAVPLRVRVSCEDGAAILTLRDLSGSPGEQSEARRQGTRFQQLAEMVADFCYELRADTDGRLSLIWASEGFRRVLGYTIEQLDEAGGLTALVQPAEGGNLRRHIKAVMNGHRHAAEFRVRCRNGDQIWIRNSVRPVFDLWGEEVVGILGAAREVSEDRMLNPLTGLPNVLGLLERLRMAIVRLARHDDAQTAVLYLDFDHFHVYNQSLGFEGGDILLRVFGDRLRDAVGGREFVAHLRGDEFAVVLTDYGEAGEALKKALEIMRSICSPVSMGDAMLVPSISAGLAYARSHDQKAEALLHGAQAAATRARSLGGGRVEIYEPAMDVQARNRLTLEGDLRTAVRNRSFPVHFQPIVNLETGQLAGFEALVRMRHPQLGLISPSHFVTVAEEIGLITEIGDIVLQDACALLAGWRQRAGFSDLTVSVNLSPHQVAAGDLLRRVDEALQSASLPPFALRLELTESAAMRDPEAAIALFQTIRERGCKLGLDDFGTGHSSLAWLRRFPVDSLKVDRSFVSAMDLGGHDGDIVELIVALGRLLSLDVIAEGVERPGQSARLRAVGCTLAQGYLFAPPLPAEEVEALLDAGALFAVR